MSKLLAIAAGCALAAASMSAFADPRQPYGMDRNSGHQSAPDLPHCDRPIGVAAVKEPDRDWWSPLGLSEPEAVLKMFALRSGCLRMVDRNQGLAMREQERGLSSSGELQRGSNMGRGQVLAAPSLYDEVLRLLSRRGYGIPEEYLSRDFSEPYHASKQVAGAWLGVYHNSEKEWDLYELAERLINLDHQFQIWRFHDLKAVERIIGYKRGTGGTSGVPYLTKALELRFFPELWQIRTSM